MRETPRNRSFDLPIPIPSGGGGGAFGPVWAAIVVAFGVLAAFVAGQMDRQAGAKD